MHAVGIDIGKTAYHVCISDAAAPAKAWRVIAIEVTNPNWWQELLAIIPANSVICFEPTGWHYLSPILTAIGFRADQPRLFTIPHTLAAHARALHISKSKTDDKDARAIAVIAKMLAEGQDVPQAREISPMRLQNSIPLRMLINAYRRTDKARTRTLNQLDALGHALWPALAQQKVSWIRCVERAAVSPREVIELAKTPPEDMHINTVKAIRRLAEQVPDIEAPKSIRDSILSIYTAYADLETEKQNHEASIIAVIEAEPFKAATERARTCPGIPDMLIAAAYAACDGAPELMSRDQFKAAIGLGSMRKQSGGMNESQRLPGGYGFAKTMLHMWAFAACKKEPFKSYMEKKGLPALKRRLLTTLWACLAKPEGKFQWNS